LISTSLYFDEILACDASIAECKLLSYPSKSLIVAVSYSYNLFQLSFYT